MLSFKVEPYCALGGVLRAGPCRLNDEKSPLFDGVVPHEDPELNLRTVSNSVYGWAFGVFAVFLDGCQVVCVKHALDTGVVFLHVVL